MQSNQIIFQIILGSGLFVNDVMSSEYPKI
jgi:hypothetical protein